MTISELKIADLADRTTLSIGGEDAISFLQNLLTCDVENLQSGDSTFGGLLSPQGKILFDFFLYQTPDALLLETDAIVADDLLRRLTFYKLRAKVDIELRPDLKTQVLWGGASEAGFADPRLTSLGRRALGTEFATNHKALEWHQHRIACGVPQSGLDFELGQNFPHDVLMDQFEIPGVAFKKGCYVGQEVVSRMHHRGTARKRMVRISSTEVLPPLGTSITANGKTIGTMGGSFENEGLALVRLDRAGPAIENAYEVTCNGTSVSLRLPDYVSFEWPKSLDAEANGTDDD